MDRARSIMEGQPSVSYTAGSINSLVEKLTRLKNLPLAIQRLKQDLVSLQSGLFGKVSRQRETNLQVGAWMKLVRELVFDIEDWLDQNQDMGVQQLDIEDEIKSFKDRVEHACELCQRYDLVVEESTDLHDPFAIPSQAAVNSPVPYEEKTGLVGMEHQANELVKLLEGEQKRLKVVSILGVEGLGKTTLAKEICKKLQGKFDCHAFVSVGRRPISMMSVLREIFRQVKSSHSGRRDAKDLQKVITDLRQFLCTKRYFIVVDGLWSTRAWKIINCALPNENRGSRALTTTCISDVANCCSGRSSDVYLMVALKEDMCLWLYQKAAPLFQKTDTKTKTAQEEYQCLNDYDESTKNMLGICDGMPLAIIVTAGLLAMKSEKVIEPNVFNNFILSSLEHCSTSEGMMKILHMSYSALSLPLKSCFLYLSVFREDYTIGKDRLIRLWISEGFIPIEEKQVRVKERKIDDIISVEEIVDGEIRCEETRGEKATRLEEGTKHEVIGGEETTDEKTTRGEEIEGEKTTVGEEKRFEESLWETGERYFNELIKRRLIQPVFGYDDDQAIGCTVHGVIIHFIKSMSSKGNFITVGADLNSGGSTDTVRRFALECYKGEDEDGDNTLASISVHLARVRSITVLGDIKGIIGRSTLTTSGKIEGKPVLPCFKHIRVLDLEDTDNLGSHNLEGIGGLVLLKHLGVAGTDIDKLPDEIGELEQLEILDLRRTKLSTLPASIAKQKRLAHLLIDDTVRVPSEILKMPGLEEITTIGVDSSSSIESVAELLRNSEHLRVLGVRLDGSPLFSYNKSVTSFLSEVARSTKLTSLSLDSVHIDLLGLLLKFPPSDQLRRFKVTTSVPILKGTAQKMASLVSITHMDIEIIELDVACVRVLEQLPNLVLFNLVSSGHPARFKRSITSSRKSTKDRCILGMGGFKRLKLFLFACRYGGTELEFTQGAMPELRRLSLRFSAHETLYLYGNFSFGIEHLSSLKLVNVKINCKSATTSEVKNAEDQISAQVENFPVVPTKEISKINQHMMLPDHHRPKTATYPKIWIKGCFPNF